MYIHKSLNKISNKNCDVLKGKLCSVDNQPYFESDGIKYKIISSYQKLYKCDIGCESIAILDSGDCILISIIKHYNPEFQSEKNTFIKKNNFKIISNVITLEAADQLILNGRQIKLNC